MHSAPDLHPYLIKFSYDHPEVSIHITRYMRGEIAYDDALLSIIADLIQTKTVLTDNLKEYVAKTHPRCTIHIDTPGGLSALTSFLNDMNKKENT